MKPERTSAPLGRPRLGGGGRRMLRGSADLLTVSVVGLFVLALLYAVYLAKPVLLPLALSLLITLILKPVHLLVGRLRIPQALAAGVVVLCLIAGIFAVGNRLAVPATEWLATVDVEVAETRISAMFAPVQELRADLAEVVSQVDQLADATERDEADDGAAAEDGPGEEGAAGAGADSGLPEPGESAANGAAPPPPSDARMGVVMDYLSEFGFHAAATLLLIFFFLAFGDKMLVRLAEDAAAEELIHRVGREVSAYLFTITAINAGLGLCIGGAMWVLGMPNPLLWGVMGTLLNYVPYLGAVIGCASVFLVAVVSLDDPALYFVVPSAYFALTAFEANVVTPMILGRRFTLNPIVVVVWFLAWGALWGIPGMLIATPTLMTFKIICSNVRALERVDRVISV